MLFQVLLLTMISAQCAQEVRTNGKVVVCNGVIFNDTYYDRIIVSRGSGRSLFLHQTTGDLFFSRIVMNESCADTQILCCNIHSKECRQIPGIHGGFAIGYDRFNDKIYFGGIDGIYVYNNMTDSAEYYAEEGNSVWGIFILKNFYYIDYPSQHLFLQKGDLFVPSSIKSEVVTIYANEDKVYFSNRSGLYMLEKVPEPETIVLSNEIFVRQITEDIHGHIYFCASDGIYMEDIQSKSIKKVANIIEPFGMAFYNEYELGILSIQLIYADEHKIYMLLPSRYSEICHAAVTNSEEKLKPTRTSKVYVNLKLDFL